MERDPVQKMNLGKKNQSLNLSYGHKQIIVEGVYVCMCMCIRVCVHMCVSVLQYALDAFDCVPYKQILRGTFKSTVHHRAAYWRKHILERE